MDPSLVSLQLLAPNCDAERVFCSGSFDDWNTNSRVVELTAESPGYFTGTAEWGPEPVSYKYHLGDWDSGELTAWGGPRPDRVWLGGDIKRDTVPQFMHEGAYHDAAYLPRIEELPTNLPLPEPFATRRIAALLPHDYDRSGRSYPVVYLQDGQNLFDEFAPYGNWELDRRLAWLAERGCGDFIVVAIDHASDKRIAEYTPDTPTSKVEEGEADAYARFLVRDLKPLIDRTYRTMPDRANTVVGGSSLGALASLHVVTSHNNVFGGAMLLSPSIWIDPTMASSWKERASDPTRIFLYGGMSETNKTTATFARLARDLQAASRPRRRIDLRCYFEPGAGHNEQAWGEVFPRAASFLFG